MADTVLVKMRSGQFERLTRAEADKLIKAGEAKEYDLKAHRVVETQPAKPTKLAKKKSK